VLDGEGKLLANLKRMLPVKQGERGLRQSDAVFAHVKNMQELLVEVKDIIGENKILAIGASDKPRRVEGSYMPCFLVGYDVALAFAAAANAKVYTFSHQEGHIAAALYSSKRADLFDKPFAAFHVSGGTTELVSVIPCDSGFSTELVGGTNDLNAGQLIDRIGVAMGLGFPCGKEMEALALTNEKKVPKRKVSAQGTTVNLSGLENIAVKMYRECADAALVSAFVFERVADALLSMSDAYLADNADAHFVFAGGVMSNSIIKKRLSEKLNASFAEPAFSCDNAVGTAYLAYREYFSREA
jgi:N6-L-threonylcarbamoyladenine synthase